jgi:phage I-like protein
MGDITFDEDFISSIVKNFADRRTDMVVDYNHGSLAENGPDTSKAAGWVKELINKGADGLWAKVEWTEEAAGYIRKKEYRYISPEFSTDYYDKLTGESVGPALLAIALTNRPFLDMAPVELAAKTARAPEFVFAFKGLEKPKKENVMLKKVIDVLKLKEDASEDSVVAEIVALSERIKLVDSLTEDVKKKDAELETVKKSLTDADARIKGLEDEKRAAKAKEAVDKLVREGRLLPKQHEWATSLFLKDEASFKEFEKDLPIVVKIGQGVGTAVGDDTGDPEKELLKLAASIQAEKKLNFNQALDVIRAENPQIYTAWQKHQKEKRSAH